MSTVSIRDIYAIYRKDIKQNYIDFQLQTNYDKKENQVQDWQIKYINVKDTRYEVKSLRKQLKNKEKLLEKLSRV